MDSDEDNCEHDDGDEEDEESRKGKETMFGTVRTTIDIAKTLVVTKPTAASLTVKSDLASLQSIQLPHCAVPKARIQEKVAPKPRKERRWTTPLI